MNHRLQLLRSDLMRDIGCSYLVHNPAAKINDRFNNRGLRSPVFRLDAIDSTVPGNVSVKSKNHLLTLLFPPAPKD